ncbi:U32 family peptidase [Tahibacter amnicola]|uniref:Ubiquinone biosynthesis protein UbiV n=1 Tax=Tahibacter amnicola TaxID=2976241 RepID=A0ABY6BKU4_9GAMM|nr:U32 family peptidase [Tahibacter amnicola]UXI70485.1 U32 family peptidase [Tahibacter amnicola]
MKLSIAPMPYFWPRERTVAFYREAAEWPVDILYLGETVCSKRRELRTRDWIDLAHDLADRGKEVVMSTLALIEAESEVAVVRRLAENGHCWIEANDVTAVQICRERGIPFVGGPSLNIYNHVTLRRLVDDGMRRWVAGTEHSRDLVAAIHTAIRSDGEEPPSLEVFAHGRLSLAWSARCFTARAFDIAKDHCGFRCIEHPDGLALATRDGRPFLRVNGIQIQSEAVVDMSPEVPDLRSLGVDVLRLSPQAEGMAAIVSHFDLARRESRALPPIGVRNGYWHGEPGMPGVPPRQP